MAAALVLAVAAMAGCEAPNDGGYELAIREILGVPDHLETPWVPAFNVPTPEKLELGRRLFYDRQLSGNGKQSCADCHEQARAFADDKVTPTGSTGHVLVRNSQGLANVAYMSTFTWANNGFAELENQLKVPLTADDPIELGITDGVRDEVFARFERSPEYAALFAEAFPESPGPVTLNKITLALATFVRAMISGNSPYDRYLAGDRDALTDEQKLGLFLFNSERFECFHCHNGSNLTTSYRDFDTDAGTIQFPFFNNGLYNVGGDGSYPAHDQGLFDLTGDPAHRGLFRPQSLRNVAVTPPYMHDGSIATLRDVVEHYAAGGRVIETGPFAGDGRVNPNKSGLIRGFRATDEEIDAVIAFLESLTDETFLTDPRLSNPFDTSAP